MGQIAARASRQARPAHSCVLATSSGVMKASVTIRDANTMCAAAANIKPRACGRGGVLGVGAPGDRALVADADDAGRERETSGAGGRVCGTGGACWPDVER